MDTAQLLGGTTLWPHQRNAIELARKYILSYHDLSSRATGGRKKAGLDPDHAHRSALIRMPTGTGKSGVIAVMTRCFEDTRISLVLTPFKALREQLADDVERKFWAQIEIDPGAWPRAIEKFVPSSLGMLWAKHRGEPCVYVGTIQALQQVKREDKELYAALRNSLSLVIFDEGHREPAPEWAETVRDLKQPTILLTATPYRNDHKVFNVDPDFVFAFSHQEAVAERFIREVKWLEEDLPREAPKFVDRLRDLYHGTFRSMHPSSAAVPRVIVRCASQNEVNDVAACLKDAGETVLAIHDRFRDRIDDYHRKTVPKTWITKGGHEPALPIFWVHQRKLIEGIDEPSFCLLAVYRSFETARELVQQIGRIVRNPGRQGNQIAYVLARPGRQRVFWEGYRRYEKQFEEDLDLNDNRMLYDISVAIQPPFRYEDRNYRERFDIDASNLHLQFRYRLAANVYRVADGFSIEELAQNVMKQWAEEDLDVRVETPERPDKNTWVIPYLFYGSPPLLLDRYLFGYNVGFTICRQIGNYLFFYDSHGHSSEYLYDNVHSVDAETLTRLFSDQGGRASRISLMNSDLGNFSVRSRTIQARSLTETAPSLTDYAHFFSTVRGRAGGIDGTGGRYVGFTRGRVTDQSSVWRDYAEYVAWIESIAEALDSDTRPLSLFNRFASFAGTPKDTTPLNILLDLDDVKESFGTAEASGGKREYLDVDDTCCPVSKGTFDVVANGRQYKVGLSFERKRARYKLDCEELEKAFVGLGEEGEPTSENLVRYLNKTQSFRVIPTAPGIIYAHKRFYQPRVTVDFLSIFQAVQELAGARSEKGNLPGAHDGWEIGSLFEFIDSLGEGTPLADELRDVDLLVCDDMGTEAADFIAVSRSQKRVIFIHAKAFKEGRKRSASGLQEVVGQAVKNLEHLLPTSIQVPRNMTRWDQPWKSKNSQGEDMEVTSRIRVGSLDKKVAWQTIQELIRDPTAIRQVWIVLGSGFSLASFRAEAEKKPMPPEVVQVVYLMQSAWSAVHSVGASLSVFCSP
jgi:superfamily II DNA or RNA helicase